VVDLQEIGSATLPVFQRSAAGMLMAIDEIEARCAQLANTLSRRSPTTTKWVVLTGAPSSGKTTLILALNEKLKIGIFKDPARPIYERCYAAGLSVDYLRTQQVRLQSEVTINRISEMLAENPNRAMFQDYGLWCHHVWCTLQGLQVGQDLLERTARLFQAPVVFFVQPLRREDDPVRIGSDSLHAEFGTAVRNKWLFTGHRVIDVPALVGARDESIAKRAGFVIDSLPPS
jgi:predicted ATPase